MTLQDFFIIWQDLGLFLYAVLKAFLPLPSLEVILVPLCLSNMDKWIIYSIEGAIGTFVGGGIGYFIAYKLGRKAMLHIASESDIAKGENLMHKYGLWAVFIGGITPIPDFLLAYLAGITHMPFLSFASCDAIARFIRSLLVTYVLKTLGTMMDVDTYGTIFSLLIMIWLVGKWWRSKRKLMKENS